MPRTVFFCFALAGVLARPAVADDVTGADRLLCATVEVKACAASGECRSVPPAEINVPRFLEVDLARRLLATTAASGESRQTPIEHLRREDGLIAIQGVERERAFSILIAEANGDMTASVARKELGVVVFGACTPAPAAGN